jgi:hypothetical protein
VKLEVNELLIDKFEYRPPSLDGNIERVNAGILALCLMFQEIRIHYQVDVVTCKRAQLAVLVRGGNFDENLFTLTILKFTGHF